MQMFASSIVSLPNSAADSNRLNDIDLWLFFENLTKRSSPLVDLNNSLSIASVDLTSNKKRSRVNQTATFFRNKSHSNAQKEFCCDR